MAQTRERSGAGFLLADRAQEEIFTPEMFTDEQLALHDAVAAFVEREVVPHRVKLDGHTDERLLPVLLKRLGELGGLGLDVPEEYGGTGQSTVTSMMVGEACSREASWTVTFGAHTGIGTLPLVYFGTPEQKARYLPKLATGHWIAAYALTEAGSGSDALAARATARRSADGRHWILNGRKQWITNAGFADLFTVFAKINGEQFSAFLVERTRPGVQVGPEEHKMGIRGSSTCALILDDVEVPADNLLGQPGKGHKIAFNILNMGRLKLGVFAVGGIKAMLRTGLEYPQERKQFGRPLIDFGLIQEKLASMVVELYALESMGYRAAGAVDACAEDGAEPMAALEEFSVESSILKVVGSETLNRAADEALQIMGGYGYMEDYPVAKVFRDARINRIFEGTNEINRLLVPGMLLKRAFKGEIPLLAEYQALADSGAPDLPPADADPVGRATHQARSLAVILLGRAMAEHGTGLEHQQEVLAALADIMGGAYALDSVNRRSKQTPSTSGIHTLLARATAIHELDRVVARAARLALDLGGTGLHSQLRPLLEPLPLSRTLALRAITRELVARGGYWLGTSSPRV